MKIRERIKQHFALRSYGIDRPGNTLFFVEAHRFTIRRGRLLFYRGARLIAAIEAGAWTGVQEGLALEDFEEL